MSLPPGLETFNNVTHSSSGGTEPWANIKSTKAYTNVFVFDGDKVPPPSLALHVTPSHA
jgi:hypothetical protein